MRLHIIAAGRMKGDRAAELVDDYANRATASGRSLGLGPVEITEIDPRGKLAKPAQSAALSAAAPEGAKRVLLDERGRSLTSRDLAERLQTWRDEGVRDGAFFIGGADGVDQAAFGTCDLKLAFGQQTWPHRLMRAMLAEQLYRAVSLIAGAPYHRD